jgi:enolase-phosphatase E1
MTSSPSTPRIRGILLDIEGTTTPIAFVHDVLFSYARSESRTYLEEHFGSAELVEDIALLREEHSADLTLNDQPPPLFEGARDAQISSIVAYVGWLIDRDRKSTGLKSLQGKIWEQGYLNGTLKAQVFPDVAPALERWHHDGLRVAIFSSGSALAQHLLFAHTEAGDLTRYINRYFDTTVGPKTEPGSYRQIAAELDLPAGEVLFISDVVNELDAANDAGMRTVLSIRPGNQPQALTERYQSIESFAELGVDSLT